MRGPDESRGRMTTAVQERRDCVATARSLMDGMLCDDEKSTPMMRNHSDDDVMMTDWRNRAVLSRRRSRSDHDRYSSRVLAKHSDSAG